MSSKRSHNIVFLLPVLALVLGLLAVTVVLPVLGQLLLQIEACIGCRGIPAVTPIDALERGFKIGGDLTAEEPDHGIGEASPQPLEHGRAHHDGRARVHALRVPPAHRRSPRGDDRSAPRLDG